MPKVANGIDLVWKPWQPMRKISSTNCARPYSGKPGVVRILAFTNYANMGIYRDAVAQFEQHLVARRRSRTILHITRKYGFGLNLEQNVARNLTPSPASAGTTERQNRLPTRRSTNGRAWNGRNGSVAPQVRRAAWRLSQRNFQGSQNYLADGGRGFLLGDGHLNYGRENVLETYYTVHLWRGIYAAPGVQHIANPATTAIAAR